MSDHGNLHLLSNYRDHLNQVKNNFKIPKMPAQSDNTQPQPSNPAAAALNCKSSHEMLNQDKEELDFNCGQNPEAKIAPKPSRNSVKKLRKLKKRAKKFAVGIAIKKPKVVEKEKSTEELVAQLNSMLKHNNEDKDCDCKTTGQKTKAAPIKAQSSLYKHSKQQRKKKSKAMNRKLGKTGGNAQKLGFHPLIGSFGGDEKENQPAPVFAVDEQLAAGGMHSLAEMAADVLATEVESDTDVMEVDEERELPPVTSREAKDAVKILLRYSSNPNVLQLCYLVDDLMAEERMMKLKQKKILNYFTLKTA